MSFSNALIPWDPDANTAVATIPENARPEGGRWALILNALLSPSPGRTLDRVYTSIGKVMETQANRTAHTLGLGPHVIAGKIKSYFGDGEERVRQLELLRTIIPTKLEKKCLKLMKYTLPTEAANTQSQAFKEIVDLVTIYPGLRVLFVQTKPLASATSLDAISALWDRSTGAPDKEWIFWRSLTATCLTDSLISAVLEKSLVTDLGKCHDEGLGVIERLLIEHCCASSEYSSALCVRYLAGVLDLPRFWLTMGTVHAHVTDKLCHRLGQVLNDIGVDIPALGPRDDSETPFDYDGLDILTVTLLHGISSWFTKIQQKDWSVQPWYESFAKVLRLLRAPRGADLLPHSHNYASNAFDTIVPTTYHGSELHVMVDGENTTSKGQPSHEDKILTDFKSENMSTLSLHSDTSNQDHTPSVECMDETESEHSDMDSAEPLTEDDESILMSDLSDAESIQMDFASDISAEREDPSRPEFGYSQDEDVVGDWNHDTMDIQQISAEQGLLNVTSYPSLADQRKQADEWRTILQQRRSDLGDNHLDTLEAMERLALVQHRLGEYDSARDLLAVVLEKRMILLGNDDPLTLGAMHGLGLLNGSLGQFKVAESLFSSVLARQKDLLGEYHPETLCTTMNLARVYWDLGQWKRAEGLQILALEKQRGLFGENNVDTVTTMRDLALTYHNQGQYKKAQELYASALEKYREILGEVHPDTLETMSCLATTYDELGRHKESEQLHQIVLQKRRILLGEDHPDTLAAMAELASAYTSVCQLENAKILLVVVLKKHKDLLGEDHPDTLRTMSHLVRTFSQLGQFSTAEELALVVLEKWQKVLGEDHPDTLLTMGQLAWTYQMQGRFDHAEELYVVLFEKQRKLLGDDYPDTHWTMWKLAETYRGLGKLQAAEELERVLGVKRTR